MKLTFRWLWGAPLALAVTAGYALGFGDIKLDSALNQPFNADVPIYSVKEGEREAVTVRIASPDTFRRFGIARPNVLDDIQVNVVRGAAANRLNVVMRSRRPIREPFLTFLLEAEWPQGRALREYTVLLDPPVTPAVVASRSASAVQQPLPPPVVQPAPQRSLAQSAAVSRPNPSPPPVAAPAQSSRPAPTRRAPPKPQPRNAAPAATNAQAPASASRAPAASRSSALQPVSDNQATDGFAGKYGPIKAGETLSGIASALRPAADISMNQMLLALYRANPSAFDGNVNRLRRGAILFVPEEQEFRSVNKRQATSEMRRQARALRAPARKTATTPVAARSSASGADSATGETASSRPIGELKLSPAPAVIERPSQAAAAEPAPEAPPEPAEVDVAVDASPENTIEQTSQAGSSAVETAVNADSASDDEAASAGSAVVGQENEVELGGENLLEPDELEELANGNSEPADRADATGDDAAVATEGGEARQLAGAEPVASETDVASFPWALLLALMALVSFCIAVFLFMRNRSQYQPTDFSTVTPTSTAGGAAVALGSAYGKDHDADDQLDDRADAGDSDGAGSVNQVLSEADAELAAGNWAAAAATLRSGLADNPGEPLLQRRLMEALHAGDARDEFLDEFDSAYAGVPENDPHWQAVAAMGRDLAPGDPRFGVDIDPAGTSLSDDLSEDDSGTHAFDESAASDFDLSDFDDGDDSDVTVLGRSNASLDVSDFEIADGDFESSSDSSGTKPPSSEAHDDGDFDLGNESLDFEFTDSFDKKDVSSAALDESDDDNAGAGTAGGLSISQMDDLSFSDDEDADAADADEDDVSIKLDLARAYLDMGEPDMAVPLLEEVQSQGSEVQKQEAATLLDRAR